MARIDLPYVQAFKDRHGRQRYYYRRGRARSALPESIGSPEFLAAYAEAKAADPVEIGAKLVKPYSISALIASYYKTSEFQKLEGSSKSTYKNMLERFRAKYGTRSAVSIQTKHLDAIFEQMTQTPGAARNLRKRLRRVFRRAVKLGWRTDNPINETDAPEASSGGFTPWSDGDIAKFSAHWPSGSRERLALMLLLCTGVRRSDAVTLGRQHVENGKVRVRQQKTKHEILVPILPELQAELDLAPLGMTFILTQHGAPFTAPGFTQWFRERAQMAGLQGRTPHGLRKAAARKLAEAGCTANEIAAITGHKTLGEVSHYTQSANQEHLAERAHAKLRGEK